ncbi:hypothetical protein FRC08_008548 [Ceratobasidium sp. 394]|nr:hypothetical protein FRC08_008548 [Ceratobasidium sp. 394]
MSIIATPASPLPQSTTALTCARSLTGRLTVAPITSENVEILKALNSQLFPVPYPDAYYAATMRPELAGFCMLIYLDNLPVGQVTCTFKPSEREAETKVYWMLMGVLPEYRKYGIGAYACQKIMNAVAEHNRRLKVSQKVAWHNSPELSGVGEPKNDLIATLSKYPISSLFMHVHVLNTGARRLYERFGFTETRHIENFYRRKSPEDTAIKDAWVFEKKVEPVED